MSIAALVIAGLLYGGNYVREKWFGGKTPDQTTNQTATSDKKSGGGLGGLVGDVTKGVKKDVNTAAKRAADKVTRPVKDAKRDIERKADKIAKAPEKAVRDTKRKVSKATNDATKTGEKKASRFSQTRKPSRFSQNRVGRGPKAVKWGGDAEVAAAFKAGRSDVFIEVTGKVVHILPLDNVGKRHQNFLFKLANNITLKVSHNIDLAPMLPGLKKGMTLRIRGEYEHNDKGGVLHWTHHDPANRHPHGWIEMNGKKYG